MKTLINVSMADNRMGLWPAHDARRKASKAPKSSGEDTTRAGQRTREIGESRKEIDPGH